LEQAIKSEKQTLSEKNELKKFVKAYNDLVEHHDEDGYLNKLTMRKYMVDENMMSQAAFYRKISSLPQPWLEKKKGRTVWIKPSSD